MWWLGCSAAAALAVPALSGAVLLAAAAAAQARPTPSCIGATGTVTFGETGAPTTWDVPAGITSAALTLYGAAGGSGSIPGTLAPGTAADGGEGTEVTATLALSGVSSLRVNIGESARPHPAPWRMAAADQVLVLGAVVSASPDLDPLREWSC